MEEKFKLIEGKKELYAEVSVATNRSKNTIEIHWFGKGNVPDEFVKTVECLLDKRIAYEKACKKSNKDLHDKYFGN